MSRYSDISNKTASYLTVIIIHLRFLSKCFFYNIEKEFLENSVFFLNFIYPGSGMSPKINSDNNLKLQLSSC